MNLFRKKSIPKQEEAPRHAPIFLFNTLSNKKEKFVSLRGNQVRMYHCGPTVYDFQHIGNLRPYVFTDILRRVFEYYGYKVQQVINITDIGHLSSDADEGEDKMTQALKREGLELTLKNMKSLGTRYAKAFKEDLKALNVRTPQVFPRASEHVEEQIALLKTLEEKGYTYKISDGIYFDTEKFEGYGKLGGIDVEKLKEGARVKINKEKRNPADFALWKFDELIGWESPWGKGFPGWHLECSAMSMKYLGKSFDIHTGGVDHISIHHNNEIAQSQSVTKKPLATYWLHNEFITIEGRKISKSIGNTVYLRQLVDRGFPSLSYRYWLLTGHYRTPMNFTWEALEASQSALFRLSKLFVEELGTARGATDADSLQTFLTAIRDDLNTPQALAVLWDVVKNESISNKDKKATLLVFDQILGIGLSTINKRKLALLAGKERRLSVKEMPKVIRELAEKREEAREKQDFEKADELRREIEKQGFSIEDTSEGPQFKER